MEPVVDRDAHATTGDGVTTSVTGRLDPAADAAAGLIAYRPMLFGLAYRLLGSAHDAEDVLQDAYLRWSGTDRDAVAEPRRYLCRIVTRLAVDRLRHRQSRRETYVGSWLPEPLPTGVAGPLDAVEQRESLSIAAMHLLERLTPAERAVYVLRTAFDLPYDEIAEALDRSTDDCRQLQHRARRAVSAGSARFAATRADQQRLLEALLAAARDGDLHALGALLAHDATIVSDGGGRAKAALRDIVGAAKVARFLAGVYRYSDDVIISPTEANDQPAVLVSRPTTRYLVTVHSTPREVRTIYIIANPDKLTLWSPAT